MGCAASSRWSGGDGDNPRESLGPFQLGYPASDEPFGHVQVAIGVHGQPVRAVEFARLQEAGGYYLPLIARIVGPALHVAHLLVVADVREQFVVHVGDGQASAKLGDYHQIAMCREAAWRGQKIGAE